MGTDTPDGTGKHSEIIESRKITSTPTPSKTPRLGSDTVEPVFENYDESQPIDSDVLEQMRATGRMDAIAPFAASDHRGGGIGDQLIPRKRKPGRPLKSDMVNARAAALEQTLEYHPDDLEALAIDLGDGKVALETALKKELSRRVKLKGSLRVVGSPVRYEYKWTRLVRKMVNLALAGDREMIKFCVERVAGKTAIAKAEDRPTSIVVQNQIPTPEDKEKA